MAKRTPNLLVIAAEGMSAGTNVALGNKRLESPNLDRLAERSVTFENAYCTQPVCTPARAGIFTGRYPHASCPDNEHNLPSGIPCFPELADFTGYRTAQFGKWHLGDEVFAQHGFQEWKSIDGTRKVAYSPGRDRSRVTSYEKFLVGHGYNPDLPSSQRSSDPHSWFSAPVNIPEKLSPDAYLAGEAVEFLRRTGQQPFIMWLNFLRCKTSAFNSSDEIYESDDVPLPDCFDSEMGPDRHLKNRLVAFYNRHRSPESWKSGIAGYWSKITLFDRYVGEVLDALEKEGLFDNTIVVFTSDHGFLHGEHQMSGKCVMLEQAIRVPMLICVPWLKNGGRKVKLPFSHVDLAPTLLAAMQRPVPDTLPGTNWYSFLNGEGDEPKEDIFVQWNGPSDKGTFRKLWRRITEEVGPYWQGPNLVEIAEAWTDQVRTIITPEGWKYNHSQLGYHELFNLREDPCETRNLAGEQRYNDLLISLRQKLELWQERTGDKPRLKSEKRSWPRFLHEKAPL